MGRHLHGDLTRALCLQTGQLALHGEGIGGGHAMIYQCIGETAAQGTDHATARTQLVQRLGQHLADTGFAVGAGNAHHLQRSTGLAVKAVGQRRQLLVQPADRKHGHSQRRGAETLRLKGNRNRARSNRLLDVAAAVVLAAGTGQKQITGLYAAAVQGQALNLGIGLGQVREQLRQFHPRPPSAGGAGNSTCCRPARLSGAMFIKRSTLDIRPPNTGAATRPP